ncbi:hypothetical protein OE88DRAFT_1735874 [Heliocybe sulcata]|uniref:Cation-transporting P-type ATPase C-terminal domain-containing protein n=1 Tax=Heliocybe sulcata TaxID=5364 RepID=A0A5C3N8Z1_9AGAM|nr:hypothetical protein OE88DRAFT_1735874 [Heliocybe sulcata]
MSSRRVRAAESDSAQFAIAQSQSALGSKKRVPEKAVPEFRGADCGIAVEGAWDAARSAADVVFLDEGLSTIITSIKVARQIFHRMKAYIVYRIALCLHLEIYLTLSMIILNETIRADLIVFIVLSADLGMIVSAYDNAPHACAPVEWELPKIWIISTSLGILLAGATWILPGTLFLTNGGVIQNRGSVQEILFLEVAWGRYFGR